MDYSTPCFPVLPTSWGLLKLTSIELMMLSNHLILCGPLLLLCSFFPSIRVFFNVHQIAKEGWAPKNWCFWIMVLEKTLQSPLDSKEIKPVHPKGNQPWIFIGRTDAETEAPILWSPDAKSPLTGKDPDAGKDWGQEEKGVAEDETAGWHDQLNGHEFEQIPRDSEGQGSPVCCSPQGSKESDTT